MHRSYLFERVENNARVREVNERAMNEIVMRQMMENTTKEKLELQSEVKALKEQLGLRNPVTSSAMHENEAATKPETDITETALRGVSIRGLRAFSELVQARCSDGAFSKDEMIDGEPYPGTMDYSELKTAHLVHTWIRDSDVSGDKRLVDCPQWVNQQEVGKPDYFMSHAWKSSFSDLLNMVFEFQKERNLLGENLSDDTRFWLDVLAVNQHGSKNCSDFSQNQNKADVAAFTNVVKQSKGGTLVNLSMINEQKSTASRVWCLYEWDHTLRHHGQAKIFFRGMENEAIMKILEASDVGRSECFNPKDKEWILEDMMANHGSKTAFNEKLSSTFRKKILKETLPPAKSKGITIRGFKKLAEHARKLCEEGFFSKPLKLKNYFETQGTTDFELLTSAHFFYLWALPSMFRAKDLDSANAGHINIDRNEACLIEYLVKAETIDASDVALPSYPCSSFLEDFAVEALPNSLQCPIICFRGHSYSGGLCFVNLGV